MQRNLFVSCFRLTVDNPSYLKLKICPRFTARYIAQTSKHLQQQINKQIELSFCSKKPIIYLDHTNIKRRSSRFTFPLLNPLQPELFSASFVITRV